MSTSDNNNLPQPLASKQENLEISGMVAPHYEVKRPESYDLIDQEEELPVAQSSPERPKVLLQSDSMEINDSATQLFGIIAPTETIFRRGENLVSVDCDEMGCANFSEVNSDKFMSLAEEYANLHIICQNPYGVHEKKRRMSRLNATALLNCRRGTKLLPKINSAVPFPILTADGRVHEGGYDKKTRIYVTSPKIKIEDMTVEEAAHCILNLFRDWDFETEADKSRVIAALFAPMMRLGIFVAQEIPFPIFCIKADKSLTGKGTLMQLFARIFGSRSAMATQPQKRAVGSFDESLSSSLMLGEPFILMDNLRDEINSTMLESFVTANGPFRVRTAYDPGQIVDSRYYILYATSNGMHSTEDLANRMCAIRIKKQPENYSWHQWPEGKLLDHAKANRGKYLGAILTVLREWISKGSPSIRCDHDFRDWADASNWIVQKIFHLPDLMDGHKEFKERLSLPGLDFLNAISLHLGQNEMSFSASEFAEWALEAEIPIQGCPEHNDDPVAIRKHLGSLLAACFKEANPIKVEGHWIERKEVSVPRNDANKGYKPQKKYFFSISPPSLHNSN